MPKTIVALYNDHADAESTLRDLQAGGFDRSVMEITSHADHTALGAGSSQEGGFLSRLFGWGVPENDAQVYAEGVRRGGSLLKLRVDNADVDRALAVLERGKAVDIEERGAAYRASGWTGYDETAPWYDERSIAEERGRYATNTVDTDTRLGSAAEAMRDTNLGTDVNARREEHIPIVEEQIRVGKREVERGRVRVRSYVVEAPVEEQVLLRDESVTVERRAVDRTVGEVPADALRERTIEVTETDEEAVVEKAARVREEVVVRKDAEERAGTIRDTVRRTEVEIDDGRTDAPRTDADRTVRRDDVER